MIQQGNHRARAEGCTFGAAKNGTEQVAVYFRTVDTGEQITWFGYFSDKTMDRTLESLAACGWDPNMGIEAADEAVRANEVEIVVEHEDYEGRTRAKVRWVNKIGNARIEAIAPAQAKSLEQRLRARALAMRQGKPAAAPAPQRQAPAGRSPSGGRSFPQPTPPNDEDMPF